MTEPIHISMGRRRTTINAHGKCNTITQVHEACHKWLTYSRHSIIWDGRDTVIRGNDAYRLMKPSQPEDILAAERVMLGASDGPVL